MTLRPSFPILALLVGIMSGSLSAQHPTPSIETTVSVSADSLFASVRARLIALGYRIDSADGRRRVLFVRPPEKAAEVELQITPNGDSSTLAARAVGPGNALAQLSAVMMAAGDATIEHSPAQQAPGNDELPPSRWRPQFFVTPGGRVWMARDGLYTADSVRGTWQLVLGRVHDLVPPEGLAIGTHMAFVTEDTAVLGFPNRLGVGRTSPILYRTTDRGHTWTSLPTSDLIGIDAMSAIAQTVWVFGTRFESRHRRAVFLRSLDGGHSWTPAPVPSQMNDVSDVYRATPSTAYVATDAFGNSPAFWQTADGGASWSPIPTPRDQGVNQVPDGGDRIEQIATVGEWLVVREYGAVFVTRRDSVHWRPLKGVQRIAADTAGRELFVITDSLQGEMLDGDLKPLWRTADRIVDAEQSAVEQVLAWNGTGFISTTNCLIYEARDGRLGLVRPKGSAR